MKAIIAISDLHTGSTVGLCPPSASLPDGGSYIPNKFQATLYEYWQHFWGEWIPTITSKAKKRIVVINGDLIDGVHHNTVNILSTSWAAQETASKKLLQGVPALCPVKLHEWYVVKGTEVHSGPNGESEESIAESIGAVSNEIGEHASYQWRLDVEGLIFQFAHHIGVTSSAAYESSAPMRELVAGLVEAAQWGLPLPDVLVRSHRHRYMPPVSIPTERDCDIMCVITPAWQLRSPHVERIDRMRMPHIGGVVFLVQEGTCVVKRKIYKLPQPEIRKV